MTTGQTDVNKEAAERASLCFILAAHASTGDGERAAAMSRGMALVEKYQLNPDDFDIPGRENKQAADADLKLHPKMENFFADVFGRCEGCGGISSTAVLCRACDIKSRFPACDHGTHGFCLKCEGLA